MDSKLPACTEISDVIGRAGIYQIIFILLSLYCYSFIGSSAAFIQFLAPEVDLLFISNTTANETIIFKSTKCQIDVLTPNETIERNSSGTLLYKFMSPYPTLTEKLNLICERSWLISLSKSSILVGFILGAFLFGILSERFGRTPFCKGVIIPVVVANVCILFSSNYVLYIAACFVYGLTIPTLAIASYISMIELLPISVRPMLVTFTTFSITMGEVTTAGFAWIIKDWFYTEVSYIAYTIPAFFFIWYMKESPLWLVVREKTQEAEQVLKIILRRNGKNLEEAEPRISLWIENIKRRALLMKNSKEGKLQDLFKSPHMRKYTLCLSWIMISACFPFYCLSANVESFASNLYVDMLIGNAIIITSCVIFTFFQTKTSVRVCIALWGLFFVVVSCIYPFFYESSVARTVISVLLRGLCAPLISSTYAYGAEVFPTTVRGLGISFLRGSGGIASMMSPFTRELANKTTLYVPILLCGVLMLPNALLLLKFLPETKGKPLVLTVEELERSAQRKIPQKENETQVGIFIVSASNISEN